MTTVNIFRVDVCHSSDDATRATLHRVIVALGGRSEDAGDEIGSGVTRYWLGSDELTVYADCWGLDVAGPEPVVRRVLAAMAGKC